MPIDDHRSAIASALRRSRNLVLQAEPGAGKTTRLPSLLLELLPSEQKVLILEPRRVAARAAAQRIAFENGWTVGGAEVGYHVRFDRRCTEKTRLVFLTEALLHRYLLRDPLLSGVGAIVFDEFHERAANTDVGLGLMIELQALERPDLQLIAMSATLETERLSQFLSSEVVRVPGATHGFDIIYDRDSLKTRTDELWMDRFADTVRRLLDGGLERRGDVLAFLPGQREIRGVHQRLKSSGCHGQIEMLFGQMDLDSQTEVLRPRTKADQPRVILATNIAESSLTVDGVATVLDSGLERLASVDSLGFTRLSTQRISASSCQQRAGRSGRQSRGVVYRLWSQRDQASFAEFTPAEILRSDLSEAVLLLAAQGLSSPESFSWYEAPPASSLRSAQETLRMLGHLDSSNRITSSGRAAVSRGLPPRLSRLLEAGQVLGASGSAAIIASMLSERLKEARRDSSGDTDLERLWLSLDSSDRERVLRVARQLEPIPYSADPQAIAKELSHAPLTPLILAAFADRVAVRRNPSDPRDLRFLLASGVGCRLSPRSSAAQGSRLLVALDATEDVEVGEPLVTQAHSISAEDLTAICPEQIRTVDRFSFDGEKAVGGRVQMYRSIPLSEPKPLPISSSQSQMVLAEFVRSHPGRLLESSEDLRNFLCRLNWANSQATEKEQATLRQLALPLEAVGEGSAAASFSDNWTIFSETITSNATRWSEITALPLAQIWLQLASHESVRLFKEIAPESIQSPSGRSHPVDYRDQGQGPKLSIKLQDLFGWRDNPGLGSRRVPITLEILGPHRRPLQVTKDLARFWSGSYHEVRSEMRARYPKHSWPVDPANEPPISATTRRRD